MATLFPKTRLSTPLTGGQIDLEKAFKLFDTGMISTTTGVTFVILPTQEMTVTVGPLRVNFDVEVTGAAGLLGPGVGACVDLTGTVDGNTAALTASGSKIGAGIEVGVVVRLILGLELQAWTLDIHWTGHHWHKHLKVTSKWVDVKGISIDLSIDAIAILIDYLDTKSAQDKAKNATGTFSKLSSGNFQTGTGLSAVDYNDGDLGTKGSAHVEPTMWVMVNFADLADAPGMMKKLHDFLVDNGGDFFFGPTVNLSIPTTVKLAAVGVEGVSYNVDSVTSGAVSASRSGSSPVPSGEVAATFHHEAGFAFGLGIGIGLHVFKILGFYKSTGPVVDFVKLLGYSPQYGGDDVRQAMYGATAAAETPRPAGGLPCRVILEEPTGAVG